MHYINRGGIQLAVNDYNRDADKVIVLVHGWPLSQKMFEYQLPALIDVGYRVVTFDLCGFGMSEAAVRGYDYYHMAVDLEAVVRGLGLDSFNLLGFSMGGAISVHYTAHYEGVQKLILLDAAAPSYCVTENNPYGQTAEDTENLIHMGYKDRPALNEYFGSIFFEQEHSEPLKNWFQRISDSASLMGEMQSLEALRDEDVFNDLSAIQVPTAIIHGKQDKICRFEMAEIMHEQIEGSVLYPIEGAGHGAFIDQMEEVNQTIIEFLED